MSQFPAIHMNFLLIASTWFALFFALSLSPSRACRTRCCIVLSASNGVYMSSPTVSIFPMDTLWEAYGLRMSRQDRVEAYENIEFAGTFFSFFLHRHTLHVVILNIFSTFCALLRSRAPYFIHVPWYVVATWESFSSSSSELQTKRIKWFILFVRPKWGVVSHFGYLFLSWIIS